MLFDCLAMICLVSNMKNAAVHFRMQGLHPPIQHLWKSSQLRDIADPQACLTQRLRRASGGDKFNAQRCKLLRKRNQAGLIGDAQQGAAHLLDAARNSAGSHVCPVSGDLKENCMGACSALSHSSIFVSNSE